MKRVYVDLDDCYSLLTEHAQERWDDIDAHGKLEDFFNLVDELFGEDVSLMEIDDYLKYEYEDIAEKLGFEPYSEEELEESFIGKLNKQILSCLNEDEEDIELTSYNFTFKVLDDNTVITFVDGNESDEEASMELACDTTDPEVLYDDLEEQMDLVVAQDLMPNVNITGTEIVGYKYDEETKQGSFEFNIFYEEV